MFNERDAAEHLGRLNGLTENYTGFAVGLSSLCDSHIDPADIGNIPHSGCRDSVR